MSWSEDTYKCDDDHHCEGRHVHGVVNPFLLAAQRDLCNQMVSNRASRNGSGPVGSNLLLGKCRSSCRNDP